MNVDKIVPVPVDLIKLSDAVKNGAVKNDIYNVKIRNIEDKIPDITNLSTNTSLSTEINEVKKEVPSITNLVVLKNGVKKEIPHVNYLVTTTDLSAIENKITTDHGYDITLL